MAQANAVIVEADAGRRWNLILEAGQCWRSAKDDGKPVTPCLYAVLSPYRCGMLAPVFDSLMVFYECALERPYIVGRGRSPSADECLLLDMLKDSDLVLDRFTCASEIVLLLQYALRSTRIMMYLSLTEMCTDYEAAPTMTQRVPLKPSSGKARKTQRRIVYTHHRSSATKC